MKYKSLAPRFKPDRGGGIARGAEDVDFELPELTVADVEGGAAADGSVFEEDVSRI